jgi:hypothetical protein
MDFAAIKKGDPVLYVVGGVGYRAVALGSPAIGRLGWYRMVSHHLSLIYLDEAGVPSTVTGAPMLIAAAIRLGVAGEYARQTAAAQFPPGPERDEAAKDLEAQMNANPRASGWQPFDKVEALLALIADPDVEMHKVASNRIVEAIQASAMARALRTPGALAEALSSGIVKQQLPSAEDLDADAADKAAADATAGGAQPGEEPQAQPESGVVVAEPQTFVDEGQTHLEPEAVAETMEAQPENEPEPEPEAVAESFLDAVDDAGDPEAGGKPVEEQQ